MYLTVGSGEREGGGGVGRGAIVEQFQPDVFSLEILRARSMSAMRSSGSSSPTLYKQ